MNEVHEYRDDAEFPVPCCPVCHLAWSVCKPGPLHLLKYADDPRKSARIQSANLRRFHPQFCKSCGYPLEVCRKGKVRRAINRYRRQFKLGILDPMPIDTYLTPSQISELADKEKCRRNRFTGNPEIPKWYTTAKPAVKHENEGGIRPKVESTHGGSDSPGVREGKESADGPH